MLKYKCLFLFYFSVGLLSIESYAQLYVQGLLHTQGEAELYVSNDIIITSTDALIENNGLLRIEGNWSIDGEAQFNGNLNGEGHKNVVFQNSSNNNNITQEIFGDMTAENAFYNLTIDKPNGQVALGNDIEIAGQLVFIEGILKTDLTSNSDQGEEYQYKVLISNSSTDAISGHTLNSSSTSSNYVEGRLARVVEGMGTYDFPIGISPLMRDEAEPMQITFNSPAPFTTITAIFNANVRTGSTETRICDVGDAPNYAMPDGTNDLLAIDCHLGSWVTDANGTAYDYDITLFPGELLLANCPEAVLYYISKDSIFDDCPDLSETEGITATGFTELGTFEIPTVKEISISTSIKEINSKDIRVNIFPNPLTKQETLTLLLERDFLESGPAQIYIYNALGKRVGEQDLKITGKEQQIKLKDIVETPGVYTLSMQGDNFYFSRTFVVQY